jgi:predicted kinase
MDDNILESIDDKSLFKAVLMIGSGGSGKSYIIKNIFKDKVKVVNSDVIFEFLLKKHNISLKIDPTNPQQHAQQMEQRRKAIELLKTPIGNYINGMLPLVVDGTGKQYDKIKTQKNELEELGYDVYCIMVNTTLEVAKQRNASRDRTVPDEIIVKSWNAIQQNIGKFSQLFGSDFFVVDNNNELNMKQLNRIENLTLNSPLKNRTGNHIIQWLKKNNKSYYSDYIKKDLVITVEEKIRDLFTS